MNRHHQHGVAIITALLIVALATVISARLATDLQLEVRRTGNMISYDQAILYIQPAEKLASNVLTEDRKDNSIDHLGESWNYDIPPIPVDGGQVSGKILDLQACFNLNSLTRTTGGRPVPHDQRFQQLTRFLGIDPRTTDAVIDWIDDDQNTEIPDGAEDGYYLNLPKPYRAANSKIHTVSTLRLIKGFEDNQVFEKIRPFVCAFGEKADINVNTAPSEILASLGNSISLGEAESVVLSRDEKPFDTLDDFLNHASIKGKIDNNNGLSVDSSYFLLRTNLEIGNARRIVYSIINRDTAGNTKIISRLQNTL